jgi:hypothetical protein
MNFPLVGILFFPISYMHIYWLPLRSKITFNALLLHWETKFPTYTKQNLKDNPKNKAGLISYAKCIILFSVMQIYTLRPTLLI